MHSPPLEVCCLLFNRQLLWGLLAAFQQSSRAKKLNLTSSLWPLPHSAERGSCIHPLQPTAHTESDSFFCLICPETLHRRTNFLHHFFCIVLAVVEVIWLLSFKTSKDVIVIIKCPSLVQPAVLRLTHRLVDSTVWVAKKIAEEQEFLHQSHDRSFVHDTSYCLHFGILKQSLIYEGLFSELFKYINQYIVNLQYILKLYRIIMLYNSVIILTVL